MDDSGDPNEHSQFAQLEAEFIIASRYGIFTIDSDMTVMRFAKYAAIGAGNRYAFGSIYAWYENDKSTAASIASAAIEAAVHFDDQCGGEVQLTRVPRRQ